MTRRQFCGCAPALLSLRRAAAATQPRILLDAAQAGKIRATLGGGGAFAAAADALRKNADSALKAGPWSVTTHRPPNVKAGPNDYYSEGPYWWPDPKNPNGPYIRKDGQRNPERFMGNRTDLDHFCTAVLALGMGASLLGDKRSAEHAATVLSVWCVDPRTRMNPNLEFGQAVRGVNSGRGTGIIDTVSLIHVAQGVALLAAEDLIEARVRDGVERWFADYLHWMTTSQKGLDEKKSGNNHATWWTAQAASYASLVGDAASQRMCWEHYRGYLVPTEIQADGSCPREEERTNSLSYSAYNLDAFSVLCRVADVSGVKLWQYRTSRGVGVAKAFEYLMPYVLHPDTWKKEEISQFSADSVIFPGLAGVGLGNAAWLEGYRALPHAQTPWAQLIDLAVRTA
jgi:hypothetical protein